MNNKKILGYKNRILASLRCKKIFLQRLSVQPECAVVLYFKMFTLLLNLILTDLTFTNEKVLD